MRNEFVHKSVACDAFAWYAEELRSAREASDQFQHKAAKKCTTSSATHKSGGQSGASTSTASAAAAKRTPDPVRNLAADIDSVLETEAKDDHVVQPRQGTTKWYAARKAALDALLLVVALVGGPRQFAILIVDQLRMAIIKTGAHLKTKIFGPSITASILADPGMRKVFTKAIDAERKPPISRFRFAKAISQQAMDGLRFAMFKGCPGHSTMRKDVLKYVKHLDEFWIPSGDRYDTATAFNEQEQQESIVASILEERAAAEEADLAFDKEVASASLLPDEHDEFTKQALAMLALAGPKLKQAQLVEKLSSANYLSAKTGGTKVFKDCSVVHVRAMQDGVLRGFLKALVTKHEICTEYVLLQDAKESSVLVPHLFDALLHSHQHVKNLRVQVLKDNQEEFSVYEGSTRAAWRNKRGANKGPLPPVGGMRLHAWTTPKKKGKIFGKLDVPQRGAIFLSETVKNALRAVEKSTNTTPLLPGIEVLIDGLKEDVTEDDPGCDDYDANTFEGGRKEDDSDLSEEQLRNTTGKGHWGARCLINALTMLLVGPTTLLRAQTFHCTP